MGEEEPEREEVRAGPSTKLSRLCARLMCSFCTLKMVGGGRVEEELSIDVFVESIGGSFDPQQ